MTKTLKQQRHNPSRHPRHKGILPFSPAFTLIEVLLVLLILSVLMGLLFPRLASNNSDQIRREAIRLANVAQWLADQSATTGVRHLLRLHAQEQTYHALILENDEYSEIVDPMIGRHRIDQTRVKMEWQDYDDNFSSPGEIEFSFGPVGIEEPLLISFRGNDHAGEAFTVLFLPGQWQAKIQDGILRWTDLAPQ